MATWALRRAFLALRNKNGFRIGASRTHHADSGFPFDHIQDQTSTFEFSCHILDYKSLCSKRFYSTSPVCGNALLGKRGFSTGNEDDQPVSEPDLSNEDDIGDGVEADDDGDETEASRRTRTATLALCSAIMDSKDLSVREAVDKWVSEGNELAQVAVALAAHRFRKSQMSIKALELSEYLEVNDRYEFDEKSYASRVGMIAKFHGLKKAEEYIETIPDSYIGVLVYQTLLAYCVVTNKTKKAEEVFRKMRDLGLPVTEFSCSQLIILYKRYDKKKLAEVLKLMKREKLKPSIVTYKLLIGTKCQLYDTKGVEKLLDAMKSDGIEPDTQTRFIVARHYAIRGLKDKAEAVLKQIEGDGSKPSRLANRSLILLHAELGNAKGVEKVWNICRGSDPTFIECLAAIEAWGKLGRVDEAEAVFDKMSEIWTNGPSNKQFTTMLNVYARNKELKKGEDLVEQMSGRNMKIGPLVWNALAKLYVEAGEVEKADSMLKRFARWGPVRPMPSTYMVIMRAYANRGDIDNSERIFGSMKEAGHTVKWHQFQDLIDAYVNAKKPAYGMWERMKAEDIFANKIMSERLKQVDPFAGPKALWCSSLSDP